MSHSLITWLEWLDAVNARRDIRNSTKCVAIALRKHADNQSGECWPKQEKLAQESGLKLSAVQKAIAELRAIGALKVELSRPVEN